MNVKVRNTDFKILITVEEEETVVGICPICSEVGSSDDEDGLTGKKLEEGCNDVVFFQRSGGTVSSHSFDVFPWEEQERDDPLNVYKSMTSLDEMTGGCDMSARCKWQVVPFINYLMDKGVGNSADDGNSNILRSGHTELGLSSTQHSLGPQEGIDLDGVTNNKSDNREAVGPLEVVGFNSQYKDTGNGVAHRKKKI